jgi:hypothetical protein
MKHGFRVLAISLVAIAQPLALQAIAQTAAPADRQSFASPEAGARALKQALQHDDTAKLLDLLGREHDELLTGGDAATSRVERRRTAEKIDEKMTLRRDRADRVTLVIGRDAWPAPIPLVRRGGKWFFDTEAGANEIVARRIGRNELAPIDTLKALVAAQNAFAGRQRAGGESVHYARYVQSSAGGTDGLWWDETTARSAGPSPLGNFVESQREFLTGRRPGDPFHGYYFRILTAQGEHAPGGAMSYIVDGKMTQGFAMIAWPAEYGDSGIMTFLVGRDGRIVQKDLGEETASAVKAIAAYDPDKSWSRAEPAARPAKAR